MRTGRSVGVGNWLLETSEFCKGRRSESRAVFPTVPGRVSKDGRAKRPNFIKTAVLGVDGRALPSLVRWLLPVVICRARLSTVGPCRQL